MQVLARPNGKRGSDVVHLPGTDGPKCGQGAPRDKEWVTKDKSMFPNARVCEKCNGKHGNPGPEEGEEQLAAKLRRMGEGSA